MEGIHVVLHTEISLDGRADGFEVNMGTYYQLAETFEPDCMISGSNTILRAEMPDPVPEWCFEAASQYPSCSRMIMAIVDSQGRVRNWAAIKKQPFWKTPLALVSEYTPKEYLEYLEREGIEYIQAGKDKVDMAKALEEMHRRFGVRKVRIDSGGILSSIMICKGLIDEISILLNPCISGNLSSSDLIAKTMLRLKAPISLKLQHVEKIDDGCVWLKYSVLK